MIKLKYLNEFGQIINSDCTASVYTETKKENYEVYNDIESATDVAQKFVKKYPLMCCTLVSSYSGEEILISADKEDLNKASKERDAEIQNLIKSKNNRTRLKFLIAVLAAGLCLIYFAI